MVAISVLAAQLTANASASERHDFDLVAAIGADISNAAPDQLCVSCNNLRRQLRLGLTHR